MIYFGEARGSVEGNGCPSVPVAAGIVMIDLQDDLTGPEVP
jgi:hypothetical protein